jgi:5-methylcytosine-specific restriction endonuclease McrA
MAKPKKVRKVRRKGKPRTAPCAQHPEWSEARYRTFVRSALRKAWMKWPPRFEALRRAARPNQSDNKRLKNEYQCAHCGGWHRQDAVSVDHIKPWGDPWSMSFPDALRALLVSVDELQVLCEPCHDIKTALEKQPIPEPSP